MTSHARHTLMQRDVMRQVLKYYSSLFSYLNYYIHTAPPDKFRVAVHLKATGQASQALTVVTLLY